MALPPTVTGAVTGATTWVPLAVPSSPEVLDPIAGAAGAAVPPVVPVASLSPRSEMALPPTVTGAVTGATACVPPRMLSSPPVVLPPAAGAVGDMPPEVPEASLSPRSEMALPPTVTGAVTGATTWVPLAVPSSPEVLDPIAAAGAGAAALSPSAADSESPSSEMALSDTVTGALTATRACVPERTPSRPSVSRESTPAASGAWGAALWGGAAAGVLVVESSVRLMALSVTVTGR